MNVVNILSMRNARIAGYKTTNTLGGYLVYIQWFWPHQKHFAVVAIRENTSQAFLNTLEKLPFGAFYFVMKSVASLSLLFGLSAAHAIVKKLEIDGITYVSV
jgi:hypothetical protein